MSHFTVLVIGDDVEGQLAPYDEGMAVAPYREPIGERLTRSYMEMWKARDDESDRPKAPVVDDLEDHPPTGGMEDPELDVLVAWLNARYGDEHYVVEDDLVYQVTTYNPKSKWDWYSIGGRWRGYFKLKESVMDTVGALAEIGEPGAFGGAPRYDADQVRKGDIDLDAMRDKAGATAYERWNRAHAIIGDLPVALSWRQVLAKYTDDASKVSDIEAARKEYQAQERVAAVKAHDEQVYKEKRYDDLLFGGDADIVEFQVTRESYIQQARDREIMTYAYVKNGEWFAPGEMGWFGSSTDNERDRVRFAREFNEMLDALPDDTLLTLVDCHI